MARGGTILFLFYSHLLFLFFFLFHISYFIFYYCALLLPHITAFTCCFRSRNGITTQTTTKPSPNLRVKYFAANVTSLAVVEQAVKDRESEISERGDTEDASVRSRGGEGEVQRGPAQVADLLRIHGGPGNRRNLEFFIQHGLYADADFVFSSSGDTDADLSFPSIGCARSSGLNRRE